MWGWQVRLRVLAALPLLALLSTMSAMSQEAPSTAADLLPTGELRVALYTDPFNPNLVTTDPETGEVIGIGADLARELAAQMGVPLAWIIYPRHGAVLAAANDDAWDVYFIGTEIARAQGWSASAPHLLVDQTYLVAAESRFRSVRDVDQPGVRISVALGSGADVFLTRELQHAELVRARAGPEIEFLFLSSEVDALASNRQDLVRFADRTPGFRVLDDFFNVGEAGIALPRALPALLSYTTDFVEWAKASGLVEQSIQRHGLEREVRVASPAATDE